MDRGVNRCCRRSRITVLSRIRYQTGLKPWNKYLISFRWRSSADPLRTKLFSISRESRGLTRPRRWQRSIRLIGRACACATVRVLRSGRSLISLRSSDPDFGLSFTSVIGPCGVLCRSWLRRALAVATPRAARLLVDAAVTDPTCNLHFSFCNRFFPRRLTARIPRPSGPKAQMPNAECRRNDEMQMTKAAPTPKQ